MPSAASDGMYSLKDYTEFDFTVGHRTREVFRRGSGPAVIVIHEIPGIHPLVIRFADRVAAAGHTVFLPSLLGEPGKPVCVGYAISSMFTAICIRREFNFWAAGRSSPIVDWLRALARKAHEECGGPGVGAIGMCFSGGFALAMMTEPTVIAPVLSQPSMPFALFAKNRSAIDVSPEDIKTIRWRLENEDLSIIALRFDGDPFVPRERFATLRECFGSRCETIELNPADAAPAPGGQKPHSVLTIGLRDNDPLGPTKRAEIRVIEFFRERLARTKTCEKRKGE
jgi:dienelactone hydrolase